MTHEIMHLVRSSTLNVHFGKPKFLLPRRLLRNVHAGIVRLFYHVHFYYFILIFKDHGMKMGGN